MEPSGRPVRWRQRLSEFACDIVYEKGNLNTRADALSRLKSLEKTTVPLDKNIPSFTDDHGAKRYQLALLSDLDVSNNVLLRHEDLQDPPLVPIFSTGMPREQQNNHFCRDIVARLHVGEDLAFSKCEEATSFFKAYGDEQIVVTMAPQTRILHLCRYAKLSGHPSERRLYHFLRHSFSWPSVSVNCYITLRNFVTCARYRVNLCRYSKPTKIFITLTFVDFLAINIPFELEESPRNS